MTEYYKPLAVIFLIIILSMVIMSTAGKDTGKGVTGYAIKEEQPETRPIQEVTKDLEEQGFEYVANDPGLDYAR